MNDADRRLVSTCWWGDKDRHDHRRPCRTRVPADPDHIGLCGRHLQAHREAA